MFARHCFNFWAGGVERADPAVAIETFHTEMILQRFHGNGARHALAVDQSRKNHGEVCVAIRGRVGRKLDVHDCLGRKKQKRIDSTRSARNRSTRTRYASLTHSRTIPAVTSTIFSDTASGSA